MALPEDLSEHEKASRARMARLRLAAHNRRAILPDDTDQEGHPPSALHEHIVYQRSRHVRGSLSEAGTPDMKPAFLGTINDNGPSNRTWVSLNEAAELLEIGRDALKRQLLEEGVDLPTLGDKRRGHQRIYLEPLESFLHRRGLPPAEVERLLQRARQLPRRGA